MSPSKEPGYDPLNSPSKIVYSESSSPVKREDIKPKAKRVSLHPLHTSGSL